MKFAVAGLVAMLAVPALAQEDLRIDRESLYVTDPAACQALEDKGLDAWMEHDFLSLDFDDGIQSMEFHCNFFDVKTREGSTHLFIDSICELPGAIYPDALAVTPYSETQIQVVSAFEATMAATGQFEMSSEVATPGATLYTRCDNLSEIPVD
ncbi:hypothetical protein [Devosia sediminis]|uniref:Uncharacterized protein n=1 Tax=Devosia sediminis TaxID=2798801 RepID=A0A934IY17_9HYPH|nr:hypothetical protein [Devosia sediminis]MBJ3784325.1 hypothetical protein [Devosia sediminis]